MSDDPWACDYVEKTEAAPPIVKVAEEGKSPANNVQEDPWSAPKVDVATPVVKVAEEAKSPANNVQEDPWAAPAAEVATPVVKVAEEVKSPANNVQEDPWSAPKVDVAPPVVKVAEERKSPANNVQEDPWAAPAAEVATPVVKVAEEAKSPANNVQKDPWAAPTAEVATPVVKVAEEGKSPANNVQEDPWAAPAAEVATPVVKVAEEWKPPANNVQEDPWVAPKAEEWKPPANNVQEDSRAAPKGAADASPAEDSTVSRAPLGYRPGSRTVEELFKDDEHCAAEYANISQGDEDVKLFSMDGVEKSEMALIEKWEDIEFPAALMENIKKTQYVRPRKIQGAAISLIMDGNDVAGHAETGSGKTAAYLIPIISAIITNKESGTWSSEVIAPLALIIAPTRELVHQIYEQAVKFTADTGVSVCQAFGQYSMSHNFADLCSGCDILCATVGRLKHFVAEGNLRCEKIKFLVFDEADVLIESNFLTDIKEIMVSRTFLPKEQRQTLMFSATFTPELEEFVKEITRDDKCVKISTSKNFTNKRIKQVFTVSSADKKKDELMSLLMKEKAAAGGDASGIRQTLVFVGTKRDCDLTSIYLSTRGIPAASVNSDRGQHLRDEALRGFRERKIMVLVATDVLARGIDIHDLDHVINYQAPGDLITYIHRVGRVGRIRPGFATTFVSPDGEDVELLKQVKSNFQESSMEVPEDLAKIVAEQEYLSAVVEEPAAPPANEDGWNDF